MKSKNYCQFVRRRLKNKIRITFTAHFHLFLMACFCFVNYHQFVCWTIGPSMRWLNALNRFTFQQIMCYLVSAVAHSLCCRYCYCQSRRLLEKKIRPNTHNNWALRAYGDPRATYINIHALHTPKHIRTHYSNRSIYSLWLSLDANNNKLRSLKMF